MKRPGASLELLVFVVVAILAVASVAALAVVASSASSTSTTQQTSFSSSTSVVEADGLELSLSVSPSETQPGEPIAVSISDFNTLTTTNTPLIVGVTSLSVAPCNQLPLGFAIYEGNYGTNNVSNATPLNMFQPEIYSCPAIFPLGYFSFAPLSDNVTLYSPQPSGSGGSTVETPMWTAPDSFYGTFSGYWAGGSGGVESATFQEFAPGVYTLMGTDDYGQVSLVHFLIHFLIQTQGASGALNTSAVSQYGLDLLVGMNTSVILPGQSLQVNLSEFNTLPKVNNVSAGGDWAMQVGLGSCRNEYVQPFGIAVYSGHVDSGNVSQAQALNIFPVVPCPMYVRLVTGCEFQPQSDLATVLPSTGTPSPLVGSVVLSGTYTSQTVALNPGAYTVVAADEWGAMAFLYFQVK